MPGAKDFVANLARANKEYRIRKSKQQLMLLSLQKKAIYATIKKR
jgi:hypothetical protein